jgi:hypothetical protein
MVASITAAATSAQGATSLLAASDRLAISATSPAAAPLAISTTDARTTGPMGMAGERLTAWGKPARRRRAACVTR